MEQMISHSMRLIPYFSYYIITPNYLSFLKSFILFYCLHHMKSMKQKIHKQIINNIRKDANKNMLLCFISCFAKEFKSKNTDSVS